MSYLFYILSSLALNFTYIFLFKVQAESDVINASWDTEGNHQGLADSIGLMVYEGTQVY